MKKYLLLFLLFPISLSAQDNKFKIGFGLNSYVLLLSDGNNDVTWSGTLPIPLFNINLNLKYILNRSYSLQSKLGYVLGMFGDYNGFEYGISGEYIFLKSYYASMGLMKHNNGKIGEYAVEANISFINGGLGYRISKYLSIEAIYFYPLNKEIIGDDNTYHHVLQPKPMAEAIRRIESMIYLSFVFGWEL